MSAAPEEKKEFVYAGGEFENDAPYVPDEAAAGGGVDDMDALLSDLIGSGSYDATEDADTCFSMNAAASFAAIIQPEEQVAELSLKVLDAETLVNIVDVVTPVELMQVTLLLEFFSTHNDLPGGALANTPVLRIGGQDAVSEWFTLAEKGIVQALSILSLSLSKETLPAGAAASSASSFPPVVYSLLFKGSKVTSPSVISSLLADLFSLLALPDVMDLDCLTKQLVKEMGVFCCEQRQRSSSSSSSAALSTLRTQFLSVPHSSVLTGTSFSLSFPSSSSCSISLPAASLGELRKMHHVRGLDVEQHGEVFVRVWVGQWEKCWQEVNQAVQKQLGLGEASSPSIESFLRSLTSHSALASLLSPESSHTEKPGAFFEPFLKASKQMQLMEAQRAQISAEA
jgi:hypothetical protein